MKNSLKTNVLGIIMSPILKRLGYESINRSDHVLPASHYYANRTPVSDLVSLHWNYLNLSGWLESRNNNRSYFNNQYQPWLTFPAIHFVSSLDLSNMKIVEFGGGASTFFFSKRASKVITYEFDTLYATQLKQAFKSTANVEIVEPDISSGLLQHWSHSLDLNPKFDNSTKQNLLDDFFVKSISDVLSKADLILIDGFHSYDAVKKDFETSLTFNPKYIVLHDIFSDACPDVVRFWNEIRNDYKHYEYINQYDNVNGNFLGIGLLEIDGI